MPTIASIPDTVKQPGPAAGAPRSLLSVLRCPYCGSSLETRDSSPSDAVEYGILHCACYEYPVVEGIPILQQVDGLEQVVGLLAKNDRRGALLRALDVFRIRWALRSRLHRLRYAWDCSRLVSRPDTTFAEAAHQVRGPKVFADYLIHRYANPSFLAAIGPLMVLEHVEDRHAPSAVGFADEVPDETARPIRVLDLACGAGHASFIMRMMYPRLSVISADQDFVNVYLARRYLAPDALQLCLDAQAPSPFPDDYFDAAYCQDAFHYFKAKKAAVQELKRICRPDAVWIFPHLHNRLAHNLVPGLPLSPESYLECFDLPGARLFSESELLQGLVHERVVDLGVSASSSKLNQSPALTLIKGSADVWRPYRHFPSTFCQQPARLHVNPIYQIQKQGKEHLLELQWPNPVIKRECSEAETILPRTCLLSADNLAQRGGAGDSRSELASLEDLVAKFVLVPLPCNYSPGQAFRGDRCSDDLLHQQLSR